MERAEVWTRRVWLERPAVELVVERAEVWTRRVWAARRVVEQPRVEGPAEVWLEQPAVERAEVWTRRVWAARRVVEQPRVEGSAEVWLEQPAVPCGPPAHRVRDAVLRDELQQRVAARLWVWGHAGSPALAQHAESPRAEEARTIAPGARKPG